AQTIEKFVVDQIRKIGKDVVLFEQTYLNAGREIENKLQALDQDKLINQNKLRKHTDEMKRLIENLSSDTGISLPVQSRMADLQELILTDEKQLEALLKEIEALKKIRLTKKDFKDVFSSFDPVWETLSIREQVRIIRLLIEQIGYDGEKKKIAITFRPAGIKCLAREYS
ncbi:MAG: hypothetical protein KJ737_12035, partial [Proteobacteria bacterium]|nr:hypothetical protein [Pseudomonadota bacterium]